MIQNPVVIENGANPVLQTKSVSPSESSQNVTPDAGYDGLSRVTVGAIQTETKTVTANGTVTPSAGKYLKQVTVNVPTSGGGIDTSDATATAEDIAAGKTAYADGKKLEGTLADYLAGEGATFASNYTEVSDGSSINFLCRGLNQGAKILRDGSYANVNVKKAEFGDATAADVASGKTFTSSAGLKITGTHVCSGGIDTSDATATASDMAEGVTAYVKGEKVTGTIQKASTVYNLGVPEVQAAKVNDTRIRLEMPTLAGPYIVDRGVTVRVGVNSNEISNVLGDATPGDVASGKTFSAGGGFTLVGTATASTPSLQEKSVAPTESTQSVTPDSGYDGLSKVTVGAIQTETKTVTTNGTVTPSSGKYLKQVTVNVPSSGIDTSDATATAGKILQGATAYVKGEKVTGTIEYYPKGSITSRGFSTTSADNVSVTTIQSKNYLNIKSPTFTDPVAFLAKSHVSCGTLLSNLGDATAADVAEGKTFTSAAGLKVTGTHVCSGGGATPTLQSKTVSPSTSQ